MLCVLLAAGLTSRSVGLFTRTISVNIRNDCEASGAIQSQYTFCDRIIVRAVALSHYNFGNTPRTDIEQRHAAILSNVDWLMTDSHDPTKYRLSRDQVLNRAIPEIGVASRHDGTFETHVTWPEVSICTPSFFWCPQVVVAPIESQDLSRVAQSLQLHFRFAASKCLVLKAAAGFVVAVALLSFAMCGTYRLACKRYPDGDKARSKVGN